MRVYIKQIFLSTISYTLLINMLYPLLNFNKNVTEQTVRRTDERIIRALTYSIVYSLTRLILGVIHSIHFPKLNFFFWQILVLLTVFVRCKHCLSNKCIICEVYPHSSIPCVHFWWFRKMHHLTHPFECIHDTNQSTSTPDLEVQIKTTIRIKGKLFYYTNENLMRYIYHTHYLDVDQKQI